MLPALLLTLGVLGLPTSAMGQDIDLTGDWLLTVESPNGTGERELTLIQDGAELSGEVSSSRAAGDLSGTIEGNEFTFVALVQMAGGGFEIFYKGTITDGVMSGTVDFGDYGSGTFTGVRVESPPALSPRR